MIPEDVKPLLRGLIERSKKREVDWLAAADAGQRHGAYTVLFPKSSLVIDDEEDGRIEGRILNDHGDTALSFWSSYREDSEEYLILTELLDLARRRVLKVDEALAEMRALVETAPRVGEAPKRRRGALIDDDEEIPF